MKVFEESLERSSLELLVKVRAPEVDCQELKERRLVRELEVGLHSVTGSDGEALYERQLTTPMWVGRPLEACQIGSNGQQFIQCQPLEVERPSDRLAGPSNSRSRWQISL